MGDVPSEARGDRDPEPGQRGAENEEKNAFL